MLWRQHKAGAVGHAGKCLTNLIKHRGHVLVIRRQCAVDLFTVFTGKISDFQKAINKQPQAKLGRDTVWKRVVEEED